MIFIMLLFLAAMGGRWACSNICPLGILQEMIFKIPFIKKITVLPYEKHLRKIKYMIFLVVLLLMLTPFGEKLGKWHMLLLFIKVFGFTAVFVMSLFIYRPCCKYFCPFGLFLGFFNRVPPFQYKVGSSCMKCGLCKKQCKMGLIPYTDANSVECIRCESCIHGCPRKALNRKENK